MVARKKQEKEEKSEETQEGQSYSDRALQRLQDSGDTRVPSDPEHFQPADIPPEPLTPHATSSTAPPEE
jgi:hypothetical protein